MKISKITTIVICIAVAVVAISLVSAPARAAMTIVNYDSYGTSHAIPGGPDGFPTDGGEFLVQPSGFSFGPARLPAALASPSRGPTQFETFCLERNEFLSFNTVYNVTIDTYATGGGLGGQTSPGIDYLDPKTAWLYQQFINGTLAGYVYTGWAARVASANALQDAMWFIEGELPLATLGNLAGQTLAFYNAAVAANPTSIGGVRVMNPYSLGRPVTDHQSQLVSLIPAPAGVVLVMIGVGLLAWNKKRLVKS